MDLPVSPSKTGRCRCEPVALGQIAVQYIVLPLADQARATVSKPIPHLRARINLPVAVTV